MMIKVVTEIKEPTILLSQVKESMIAGIQFNSGDRHIVVFERDFEGIVHYRLLNSKLNILTHKKVLVKDLLTAYTGQAYVFESIEEAIKWLFELK